MAIARDTAADLGNNGGSTTSLTTSFTVGSGSDRLLVVGVVCDITSDLVTGVTYNSVAMTLIAKVNSGGHRWTYMYYLVNPASGAHNVVISISSTAYVLGLAASYTGVNQTGQPDASTSQTAAANNLIATSLTTVADNSWQVLVAEANSTLRGTASAELLARDNAFDIFSIFDSLAGKTPPGSKNMTITQGVQNSNVNVVMASFAPSGGTLAVTRSATETNTLTDVSGQSLAALLDLVDSANLTDQLAVNLSFALTNSDSIVLAENMSETVHNLTAQKIPLHQLIRGMRGIV